MGDLSPHFSRSEFACKGENCCGGSAPIDRDLIIKLETVREKLSQYLKKDTPLHINSGFRCLVHNKEIGSVDSSQHPLGLAADIDRPEGIEEVDFYVMLSSFYFKGLGRYDSFTHVDMRQAPPTIYSLALWDNRTKTEPPHAT